MVRYADDARYIKQALQKRFSKFGLELHPGKTKVISFGRYERENARKQNRKANTFDFLGFTHFCGKSRKGKFIVGRKTSKKKFRKKCREMNEWLKKIRNYKKTKVWWSTLKAKLRGHYQYYGVTGNVRSIRCFHYVTIRLVRKWLNRRSQHKSFSWAGFSKYLKHYPLPLPRITCNLYALSPVA